MRATKFLFDFLNNVTLKSNSSIVDVCFDCFVKTVSKTAQIFLHILYCNTYNITERNMCKDLYQTYHEHVWTKPCSNQHQTIKLLHESYLPCAPYEWNASMHLFSRKQRITSRVHTRHLAENKNSFLKYKFQRLRRNPKDLCNGNCSSQNFKLVHMFWKGIQTKQQSLTKSTSCFKWKHPKICSIFPLH